MSTSSLKKTVNCESGNMWNLCLCKNTKFEKDESTITISMAHTYSVYKYDWKSLCIVCTWMICQIQILRKGVLFIFKEISLLVLNWQTLKRVKMHRVTMSDILGPEYHSVYSQCTQMRFGFQICSLGLTILLICKWLSLIQLLIIIW